ncbi:unnamed protein product [Victoria cruziana]
MDGEGSPGYLTPTPVPPSAARSRTEEAHSMVATPFSEIPCTEPIDCCCLKESSESLVIFGAPISPPLFGLSSLA